jgi:hypothetical protein
LWLRAACWSLVWREGQGVGRRELTTAEED